MGIMKTILTEHELAFYDAWVAQVWASTPEQQPPAEDDDDDEEDLPPLSDTPEPLEAPALRALAIIRRRLERRAQERQEREREAAAAADDGETCWNITPAGRAALVRAICGE